MVDMFWLTLLAAILVTWYQDRQELLQKLKSSDTTRNRGTSWSIDQLLGKPNTPVAGDMATAWASQNPYSGTQWVIVEFPKAVNVASIEIIETYNPGAVVSLSNVSATGVATEIWSGMLRVTYRSFQWVQFKSIFAQKGRFRSARLRTSSNRISRLGFTKSLKPPPRGLSLIHISEPTRPY